MPEDRHTTADSRGRLSAAEASELAGQVAALAESGLPLPSGFRALAEELSGGHLAGTLRAMAESLEAGDSLDEVFHRQGSRFPAHVRELLLAGIRSGRLAEVMGGLVDRHRAGRELARRVWLTLAYPILLMSMLSVLFFIFDYLIVDYVVQTFEDFDAGNLPLTSRLLPALSSVGAWACAGGTVLLVLAVGLFSTSAAANPAVSQLLHSLPLLGPLWRFGRLAQFARLMAMLLDKRTPLPEALRLAASGVCDGNLAAGCRQVARDVEAGQTLAESLASHWQFPPTMHPLIDWGQRTSALPEAFEAAAEVFDAAVQSRETFLQTAVTPLTFLFVLGAVSLLLSAAFSPLISLIDKLSSS